jgi:hypothetical protein
MKFASRHFAAAALAFCPLFMHGQQAPLPSAPSAVAVERGFAEASQMNFTVLGPTVAQPQSSSRLNSDQKFSSFVEQSMSPYATFSSAIAAGFRPSFNSAQTPENYANRFGHAISDRTEQGFFTKFLLPSMLHQDPRYFASEDTGTVDRASYALTRVLVGRTDGGKATLNTSELLGAVIAASLSSAYHPYRHLTPGETASHAAGSIAGDAGMNMLREFWPDIRERVMDHGPKVMQSLVTRFGPRVQSTGVPPTQ